MLGIDISKWNSYFDWQKSVNQGVELAYIKAAGCGDWGNYEDFRFKDNSSSCILPYKGSYFFFDYRKHGTDQCKYYLDKNGGFGNLRGMLDIEDNSVYGWAKLDSMVSVALRNAMEFVTEYEKQCGHLPGIYMSTDPSTWQQWTVNGYKYTFRNFTGCPLWVARYDETANPLVIGKRKSAWTDYAMWQYSSKGDGAAYGNTGAGNIYIDLNKIKNLNALLKPGITIEDPVILPVEISDSEKLKRLWNYHPELQ